MTRFNDRATQCHFELCAVVLHHEWPRRRSRSPAQKIGIVSGLMIGRDIPPVDVKVMPSVLNRERVFTTRMQLRRGQIRDKSRDEVPTKTDRRAAVGARAARVSMAASTASRCASEIQCLGRRSQFVAKRETTNQELDAATGSERRQAQGHSRQSVQAPLVSVDFNTIRPVVGLRTRRRPRVMGRYLGQVAVVVRQRVGFFDRISHYAGVVKASMFSLRASPSLPSSSRRNPGSFCWFLGLYWLPLGPQFPALEKKANGMLPRADFAWMSTSWGSFLDVIGAATHTFYGCRNIHRSPSPSLARRHASAQ